MNKFGFVGKIGTPIWEPGPPEPFLEEDHPSLLTPDQLELAEKNLLELVDAFATGGQEAFNARWKEQRSRGQAAAPVE